MTDGPRGVDDAALPPPTAPHPPAAPAPNAPASTNAAESPNVPESPPTAPPAPGLAPSDGRLVAFDGGEPSSGYLPFAPLRAEPPPKLFATWWLRYLLALTQLVAIAVVLLTEYGSDPGDVAVSAAVVVPHVLAAVLLVSWSALAMIDAGRLVPATLYQKKSRASVAVVLWLLAFAAPVAAYRVVDWARERFAVDSDDVAAMVVAVFSVMLCFLLVWLPFSYHTRQAHRIGAPSRVVAAWFWLPLFALVGALVINVLGLDEILSENGFTAAERTLQVGIVYGVPAFMLTLSTWRATTVFDEVIDLRWRRWRTEWHQTLDAMAAQPAPGPEAPR